MKSSEVSGAKYVLFLQFGGGGPQKLNRSNSPKNGQLTAELVIWPSPRLFVRNKEKKWRFLCFLVIQNPVRVARPAKKFKKIVSNSISSKKHFSAGMGWGAEKLPLVISRRSAFFGLFGSQRVLYAKCHFSLFFLPIIREKSGVF